MRHLILLSVERRFGGYKALTPVEWLTGNGSAYTAEETVAYARQIGLIILPGGAWASAHPQRGWWLSAYGIVGNIVTEASTDGRGIGVKVISVRSPQNGNLLCKATWPVPGS